MVLGFIGNIGGPELLVIVIVAVFLFGGSKDIKPMAKSVAELIKGFREASDNVKKELKTAIYEEDEQPSSNYPAQTAPSQDQAPQKTQDHLTAQAPTHEMPSHAQSMSDFLEEEEEATQPPGETPSQADGPPVEVDKTSSDSGSEQAVDPPEQSRDVEQTQA